MPHRSRSLSSTVSPAVSAPTVLALALAAAVGVVSGLSALRDGGFVDLAVYRFGGDCVRQGTGLYDGGAPGSGLPFTYPPFAALLFVVVAAPPFALAVGAWNAVGVLALGRTLREYAAALEAAPVLAAAWLLPALAFEPVWSTLSFAQVNLVVMLAVTIDVLRPERRGAGVLVGLAAGVKLTPLVFVVLLLLTGRVRAALLALGTFAATVAVGFVAMPGAAWAYWSQVLWDPGRVGGVAYAGNQSLLGLLTRLAGREPAGWVWLTTAAAIGAGVLLLAAAAWRRGAAVEALSLGAAAMLLSSPISWSHHWVWAAPVALLLLTRARRRWSAVSWTAVFVSGVIWWPPERGDRELGWSPWQQLAGNAYLEAALLAVCLAGLARQRARFDGRQGRSDLAASARWPRPPRWRSSSVT